MSRSIQVCLLVCIAMVGCSQGPTLGKVTGQVNYEGKPLPHGTILFEISGGGFAYGEIKDGQIINVATSDRGVGVPLGEASVVIQSIETVESKKNRRSEAGGAGGMDYGRDLIPVRYSNPATSGLSATIERGENVLTFDLTK
ncbi:hypothetical protein M4951_00315 [Blastopirellula sp. J2-11]|uniref:hypothetical protein n=1 Tax=Blastopirellula sp. J2-11 TaxID=2943192 RepID=UPI0021C83197|nr:hypothetical protein [Blastopirellula sp. J2-11]UUO06770.1 hypothetical protein M4951_00315 [Blastopirellula sp. J2-11]